MSEINTLAMFLMMEWHNMKLRKVHFVFSIWLSVSNGNHMLNANTTSSVSHPAHSTTAPTTFDAASFVSHGVSTSNRPLFCFVHIVSFCFLSSLSCSCHLNRHPSDLGGDRHHMTISCTLFCSVCLPDVAFCVTDPVIVRSSVTII